MVCDKGGRLQGERCDEEIRDIETTERSQQNSCACLGKNPEEGFWTETRTLLYAKKDLN